MYVARGRIPGVGGGAQLVEGRSTPGLAAHKARVRRRGGTTSTDADLRAHGVPVFDRQAGQSELGSYLRR